MDEMTVFEQAFEDRVRTFALAGVRPVDPAAVAHAVAVGQPGRQGQGSWVRWRGGSLDRRVWTMAAVLGLLVATLGGALLVAARLALVDESSTATNGWIAFTVGQPAPDGTVEDFDIWLVAFDREARRVVGSETDRVQQLCPAFSPDGRSLAYGRVEGHGTEYFMSEDGGEGSRPASYRRAALVLADVSDDGRVSERLTVDVGDWLPPPCPVWSPDGETVAFGENRTSRINPTTSAEGSEVWIVTLADRDITVLPDLLATDLEWAPDGSQLAIASGEQEGVGRGMLRDGGIRLYDPASGVMRPLDGTGAAVNLAWSPDGGRIAWAGLIGAGDSSLSLRVIDLENGEQQVLVPDYGAIHGIGPVWSPDGETIAYQRCRGNPCGGERHQVVLVTPGNPSDEGMIPEQIVIPDQTAPGSGGLLFPYRVTWSPDGESLLYMAWEIGGVDPLLVAVPADLQAPPVVVTQLEGIDAIDGYPDTTLVPIQTWARAPSD